MGLTKHVVIAATFLVSVSSSASGQFPTGYNLEPRQALPDSLRESWSGGRFAISITRASRDSLERFLIEQAERLFPPTDSIVARTRGITGPGHVAAFEVAARMPGRRWWWRDWDTILLPYALTGATVAHYIDRVRSLSTIKNPFDRPNAPVQHRASVVYTANVRHMSTPGVTYVVELHVDFRFYCGPLCALYFTHSRVVEFDSTGTIVAVRGDGPPRYVVS